MERRRRNRDELVKAQVVAGDALGPGRRVGFRKTGEMSGDQLVGEPALLPVRRSVIHMRSRGFGATIRNTGAPSARRQ